MNIYSVEFNNFKFPSNLENFNIYKKILQINHNKYKLKYVTKTNNSFIFGKKELESDIMLKSLTVDGIKIIFSI